MNAPSDDVPQLWSVARAAEQLDVSRGHVYNLIAIGKLRAVEVKVTGPRPKTRVYASDVADFIAAHTRGGERR